MTSWRQSKAPEPTCFAPATVTTAGEAQRLGPLKPSATKCVADEDSNGQHLVSQRSPQVRICCRPMQSSRRWTPPPVYPTPRTRVRVRAGRATPEPMAKHNGRARYNGVATMSLLSIAPNSALQHFHDDVMRYTVTYVLFDLCQNDNDIVIL